MQPILPDGYLLVNILSFIKINQNISNYYKNPNFVISLKNHRKIIFRISLKRNFRLINQTLAFQKMIGNNKLFLSHLFLSLKHFSYEVHLPF